jgi:hypothetical protein
VILSLGFTPICCVHFFVPHVYLAHVPSRFPQSFQSSVKAQTKNPHKIFSPVYGWWSEVKWSEVKVQLKLVCYTCGLTTLETRYSCFSYIHFILICTVVVLYCFVVCVYTCVCMSVFCNVCVCEGFVMCGVFLVICILYCDWGFSYPDWGFSMLFPQL